MFKIADALDIAATAKLLRSSPYSVRLWIHQKKLSAYKIGGKYYCAPEDIEAFLATGRSEARGQRTTKKVDLRAAEEEEEASR